MVPLWVPVITTARVEPSFFSAREELGDENPDDARRAAQARVDAVNHRARVLDRV
jgi:hypothetical protein